EDLLRSKIEDCRRELGGDHEHTLWALSTLASHLAKEGRLEEAEGLLRETRGHFSPVLGEDSHWVLVLTRAIAGIHLRRGELAQAARLYRHVLDARRRAGLDDLETFNARVDMAQVLARQGKLLQAESLYREQLEVRRRVDGPDYPFTIVTANELASFLFEYMPDKLDEVESMCRSMVEDLRRVLGDDHNHTFGAMYRLALALEARGKLDEAEDNYRGALAGRRRTIGPELTGTRFVTYDLARFLADHRPEKADQAESLFLELLEIQRQGLGDDHEETLATLTALADLCDAQGKPQKAAEYRALLREAEETKVRD
ncbi:MAG: tetratricopeptide repeat protein, partial [Planctomycetota bacterium]